jgi:microcystin-dependent protein
MALPVRKGYKGAPAQAVLTNSPTSGDTSFVVDTVTGWATTFPFYCVVNPGTSKEEKVKVTAISTLTLTVVRAQDDTSASGHSAGAAIYPVFTADEADEANEIASVMTTKGDLIATNGSAINRLGIGTNTHVLQADSAATNGFKWGQVVEAGIADSAVTSAKIANSTIVLGDLAASLQAFLVPVGTINAYAGAAAPTGWLLCNGTSTSGYTALAALVGATTPDLTGKFPMGKTAAGTGSTLLGTGGSNTIAEANLPSHTHTITHNHDMSNHTHTISGGVTIYDGGASGNWGLIASTSTGNINAIIPSTVTSPTGGPSSNTTGSSSAANTGGTGSGTAYYQPFVSVNYIIKHD